MHQAISLGKDSLGDGSAIIMKLPSALFMSALVGGGGCWALAPRAPLSFLRSTLTIIPSSLAAPRDLSATLFFVTLIEEEELEMRFCWPGRWLQSIDTHMDFDPDLAGRPPLFLLGSGVPSELVFRCLLAADVRGLVSGAVLCAAFTSFLTLCLPLGRSDGTSGWLGSAHTNTRQGTSHTALHPTALAHCGQGEGLPGMGLSGVAGSVGVLDGLEYLVWSSLLSRRVGCWRPLLNMVKMRGGSWAAGT